MDNSKAAKAAKIGLKTWILVWGLGLAGQLCWNIENQWFNTFIYAKIAKDPSIISWMVAYYGEMITYVGMTAPMAVYALIVWLKNPFAGKRAEVKVNRLRAREYFIMALIAAAVTVAFYFILEAFHTANLIPSTISVTTSFVAVYLTARRSPFYALAYAANDIVLIVLWSMAAAADPSCLSVIICFCVFLVNDLYGFVNWMRMQRRQARAEA